MSWNPRYVAFARSNGRTVEEQIAIDRARPSGRMMPFILWNSGKVEEFRKLFPDAFSGGFIHDHAAYDRWLAGAL